MTTPRHPRTRQHLSALLAVPLLVALGACSDTSNSAETANDSATITFSPDDALGTTEGPSAEEQAAYAEAEANYLAYIELAPQDSRDPVPEELNDYASQYHQASTRPEEVQKELDEFNADDKYYVTSGETEWFEPRAYSPNTEPPSLSLRLCSVDRVTFYNTDGTVKDTRVTPEGEPLAPDEPSYSEVTLHFWNEGDGWRFATSSDFEIVDSCER